MRGLRRSINAAGGGRATISYPPRPTISSIAFFCVFCVYTVYTTIIYRKRNSVSFQHCFPGSSFAELAEQLGVFVAETTIKSDRFKLLNATIIFTHCRPLLPRQTQQDLSSQLLLPNSSLHFPTI